MEVEINRRVEELVEKRMASERERRAQEIELEVQRRVAEAKRVMSREMLEELERQKQLELQRFLEKEVRHSVPL
jgi:arginine/glutamate-rich protein 1